MCKIFSKDYLKTNKLGYLLMKILIFKHSYAKDYVCDNLYSNYDEFHVFHIFIISDLTFYISVIIEIDNICHMKIKGLCHIEECSYFSSKMLCLGKDE